MSKDGPKKWVKERFDYLTTTQVKCKVCGAEMDVRAGRAWKHYSLQHKETPPAPAPQAAAPPEPVKVVPIVEVSAPRDAVAPAEPEAVFHVEQSAKGAVRGSREWAIEEVLKIAAAKNATHEQKLKALDLLKEYEQYGSKRLDDEKESAESIAQWERVFAKADRLKAIEAKLLKDASVRGRLQMALTEASGG